MQLVTDTLYGKQKVIKFAPSPDPCLVSGLASPLSSSPLGQSSLGRAWAKSEVASRDPFF